MCVLQLECPLIYVHNILNTCEMKATDCLDHGLVSVLKYLTRLLQHTYMLIVCIEDSWESLVRDLT